MSVLNTILARLQAADPEFEQRVSPRRNLIKNAARATTLAALPLALGGLLKRAYGKTNDDIKDTLELALTAERLEVEFYRRALFDFPNLIPSGQDKTEIKLIHDNEVAHRAFTTQPYQSLYGPPPAAPNYDFSGGSGPGGAGFGQGPYADVFLDYPTFLAVAQTFETNGVRAYKGGAPKLMGNDEILQAALNIHSVEARHAAHLMMMRRRNGHATELKPWLTGADPKIPAGPKRDAAAGVYAGEENTSQAGQNIVGIGNFDISQEDASEAFDEPLTREQVLANVDPFLA